MHNPNNNQTTTIHEAMGNIAYLNIRFFAFLMFKYGTFFKVVNSRNFKFWQYIKQYIKKKFPFGALYPKILDAYTGRSYHLRLLRINDNKTVK